MGGGCTDSLGKSVGGPAEKHSLYVPNLVFGLGLWFGFRCGFGFWCCFGCRFVFGFCFRCRFAFGFGCGFAFVFVVGFGLGLGFEFGVGCVFRFGCRFGFRLGFGLGFGCGFGFGIGFGVGFGFWIWISCGIHELQNNDIDKRTLLKWLVIGSGSGFGLIQNIDIYSVLASKRLGEDS
jgi:hypothetical protein